MYLRVISKLLLTVGRYQPKPFEERHLSRGLLHVIDVFLNTYFLSSMRSCSSKSFTSWDGHPNPAHRTQRIVRVMGRPRSPRVHRSKRFAFVQSCVSSFQNVGECIRPVRDDPTDSLINEPFHVSPSIHCPHIGPERVLGGLIQEFRGDQFHTFVAEGYIQHSILGDGWLNLAAHDALHPSCEGILRSKMSGHW